MTDNIIKLDDDGKNKNKESESKDKGKLTIEDRVTIKELEDSIESMKADKEKKCSSAKEQLIEMLKVTVDKYRTATGTAEALRTLRFAVGDGDVNLTWANKLAWDLSYEVEKMIGKAQELSYANMDQLCDGFYDKEFMIEGYSEENHFKLAFEMMRIDLCRNVGPAAEDMVEFIKRTQEEIDKTGEELKKLKSKEEK